MYTTGCCSSTMRRRPALIGPHRGKIHWENRHTTTAHTHTYISLQIYYRVTAVPVVTLYTLHTWLYSARTQVERERCCCLTTLSGTFGGEAKMQQRNEGWTSHPYLSSGKSRVTIQVCRFDGFTSENWLCYMYWLLLLSVIIYLFRRWLLCWTADAGSELEHSSAKKRAFMCVS
jgi:hypothetical protein